MSADAEGPQRRRVVIVGGGFGGVAAARHLKHAAVDVTLIDQTNHQLFQPLIYQLAAGALSSGEVAAPIRAIFKRQPNATVLMGSVSEVDVAGQEVVLDRDERIEYDSLIMACGGQTSYFGHEEWREASCPLKTLADAQNLRNRIFSALEEAERTTDQTAREEWLTFVVVGGGPTGVEIAGQLAVLTRLTLKRHFRRFAPDRAKVVLLDAGKRVVPAFSEATSARAAHQLAKLGVSVREGAKVTAIDSRGVTVEVGDERIMARTVVWAAGVTTADVAAVLAVAADISTDTVGRIKVDPDLCVPGHPEISVIGDAANLAGEDGRPLPGLATTAIQQARHVAAGIRAGSPGASKPFRYFDKGALAVVGRGSAVGEVRGRRLSGAAAFLLYLAVHLYYLGGVGGRRVTVLAKWISAGFGARQNAVIERGLARSESAVRPSTGPADGAPRVEGNGGAVHRAAGHT